MSLLQDIKESFESRSYLDEESMEGQNFNDTVEDDCVNQADVERSGYSDRKAEEEYEKEQEAVRSTIELLEENLEDIKSLSPAYTESAKEVVNAQLADASQALSLESGFGQLELDDTGRVSMESYLEVRRALNKARYVYTSLSLEGFLDFFKRNHKVVPTVPKATMRARDEFSTVDALVEMIEKKLAKPDVTTVKVDPYKIPYDLQGNLIHHGSIVPEFGKLVRTVKDVYAVYHSAKSRVKSTIELVSNSIDKDGKVGPTSNPIKSDKQRIETIVKNARVTFNGTELVVEDSADRSLPMITLENTKDRQAAVSDFPVLSVAEIRKIVDLIKKEFTGAEADRFNSNSKSFRTTVGLDNPNFPFQYLKSGMDREEWGESVTPYVSYEHTYDTIIDVNRFALALLRYCEKSLSVDGSEVSKRMVE